MVLRLGMKQYETSGGSGQTSVGHCTSQATTQNFNALLHSSSLQAERPRSKMNGNEHYKIKTTNQAQRSSPSLSR